MLTLYNPMDCNTLSFPLLPNLSELAQTHLSELAQTHVHWVSDAIQSSHPLWPPSPPAFYRSQHQALFQWVVSSHQVTIVLEHQLQHQSFQWIIQDWFPLGLIGLISLQSKGLSSLLQYHSWSWPTAGGVESCLRASSDATQNSERRQLWCSFQP